MQHLPDFLRQGIAALGGLWGGVGLFFIAFCDSSFVSLPEINDLLIIYFCTRFKEYAYFYALMATLGSVAGCSALYWLGRWKGYGFLRRKYPEGRLEAVMQQFRRYGALALLIPAMWPPPLPFKIFVLSAGILGVAFPRFLAALSLGRAVRYFFEAAVAVRYGDRAVQYVSDNYITVAVALIAVLLVGYVGYRTLKTFRRRPARAVEESIVTLDLD